MDEASLCAFSAPVHVSELLPLTRSASQGVQVYRSLCPNKLTQIMSVFRRLEVLLPTQPPMPPPHPLPLAMQFPPSAVAAVLISSLLNVVQGAMDALKLNFTFQVRWAPVWCWRLNRAPHVRSPRSPSKDSPLGHSPHRSMQVDTQGVLATWSHRNLMPSYRTQLASSQSHPPNAGLCSTSARH